jgi:hypothetical protein
MLWQREKEARESAYVKTSSKESGLHSLVREMRRQQAKPHLILLHPFLLWLCGGLAV